MHLQIWPRSFKYEGFDASVWISLVLTLCSLSSYLCCLNSLLSESLLLDLRSAFFLRDFLVFMPTLHFSWHFRCQIACPSLYLLPWTVPISFIFNWILLPLTGQWMVLSCLKLWWTCSVEDAFFQCAMSFFYISWPFALLAYIRSVISLWFHDVCTLS